MYRVGVLLGALLAATAAAQYGPRALPQPEAGAGRTVFPVTAETTGVVRDVDPGAGRLRLETEGRVVELRLPPAVLEAVRAGERITVQVALAPGGRATDVESTSSEGAGSSAIEPETGAPGARPPGAQPPPGR
jgi:hypothetical protein